MQQTIKKFIFLLGSLHILLGGPAKQGEAYEYFLKGEYEILQQNFSQAEKHYSKALSLAPDSPTILRSLVDLKSYQGKYQEAIHYLEKIFELEPANKDVGMELYQLHIQSENLDKAETVMDSLLKYDPNDEKLLYTRANTQYLNQEWKNLIHTYHLIYLLDIDRTDILLKMYEIGVTTGQTEVVWDIMLQLKIDFINPVVLELLIEMSSNSGEYTKAIEFMQELITISGTSTELHIRLSELYLRNEQFDKVIAHLRPIFDSGENSIDILRMLLIAYSTLEQNEQEIIISQQLIDNYPELSIGYEALSYAYLEVGEDRNAKEILLNALPKFPESVTIPYTLASIYNSSYDFVKAEKFYKITLAVDPDLVSVKHALAIMYEEMEDTSRSDSLFLEMIQQNENDAVGRNDYAYILSERDDSSPEELNYALELAENAIAMEPDNPAFLDTIGWIYYKLGTYHKAEEYLEKSLNSGADNPIILEHMGDIYFKLNKSAEALNLYEKILEVDSENQLIKDKIQIIHGK